MRQRSGSLDGPYEVGASSTCAQRVVDTSSEPGGSGVVTRMFPVKYYDRSTRRFTPVSMALQSSAVYGFA